MTIDERSGGEDMQVHAPSINAPNNNGELPNPKHLDFRDTQSLILPLDRVCTPDDPQVRQMQTREAAVRGTWDDRANFLCKEVFVRTPDVTYILSTVAELLGFAGLFENPGGMRILAPSGMGKDALIRYLLRKYPHQPHGMQPRYPIIYVDFRHRLAPGDILRYLLDQMGCVYKNDDSVSDLEDTLIEAMDTCGTLGIIFNESQHAVSATKGNARVSARLAGESGDWLKKFLDKVKRAVFMFGTLGWDDVFEKESQLGSRISHHYEISPFQLDKVFFGVLKALDEAIPMPEPAGLANTVLANNLFSVSKGVWRPLIYLLRNAIISATRRGSPRIEECDLYYAYHILFGPRDNPFTPKSIR